MRPAQDARLRASVIPSPRPPASPALDRCSSSPLPHLPQVSFSSFFFRLLLSFRPHPHLRIAPPSPSARPSSISPSPLTWATKSSRASHRGHFARDSLGRTKFSDSSSSCVYTLSSSRSNTRLATFFGTWRICYFILIRLSSGFQGKNLWALLCSFLVDAFSFRVSAVCSPLRFSSVCALISLFSVFWCSFFLFFVNSVSFFL